MTAEAQGEVRDVDAELLEAAQEFITRHFVPRRHQIGAVLLDAEGALHFGLHLEAAVGRASICAEAGALSAAVVSGGGRLEAVVAVRHPLPGEDDRRLRVVPPCGLCRELLLDYAPELRVICPASAGGGVEVLPLAELLPRKYRASKWLPAESKGS